MTFLRVVIALLVTGLVAINGWGSETTGSKNKAPAQAKAPDASSENGGKAVAQVPALTIYYFHGHVRCTNCINFEHFTEELLKKDFAEDFKSGRIQWKVINVDLPENGHYVNEYKLFTKSLVLVRHPASGKNSFKNLTDIWKFAGDKAQFQAYVKSEIEKMLREKPQ